MNQRLKNKVVIIGAGPAGLITALFLAKKQIYTILLDKASFPRHKACGDNVTGNALRIINELDDSWLEKMGKYSFSLPIEGLTAYAPNCHHIDIDFLPLEKETDQPSCYTIPRIEFDNFLMERAKENQYIKVIENCIIDKVERIKTGGLQIKTKSENLIIDTDLAVFCTGSNSNLINDLFTIKKRPKDLAVGVRAYFEGVKPHHKPNFCEVIMTEKLLPGGIYITPFPNGTTNVNVVMLSDVVQKKKINLSNLMMEVLKEHPILKERFENATMIGKPLGSSLFLGTKRRKISGDNYLLVGDAAGLIDLLSANGIPQAMLSAKIAAEEISRCIIENNFSEAALAPYDIRVHKRLENYLTKSRFIAPFVGYNLFIKLSVICMNFLAKKSSKNKFLEELISGNQILNKIINPSFYFRLFFGIKNIDSLKQ